MHVLKREKVLLNNDILIAALFLNPRFRRTLNTSQKENSKAYLKKLVYRIISFRKVYFNRNLIKFKQTKYNKLNSLLEY